MHRMLMLHSHGMGWGEDVNVPSTTFPRPCARCWCYAHMGWGGDVITFLRPRCLDLAQDADATLGWRSFGHVPSTLHRMLMLRSHGVGWGGVGMLTFPRPCSLDLAPDVDAALTWGCYNVPSATFPRPCTRCWCCAHMRWRSLDHVPSTMHRMLMLHSHGVGWGGML